MPHTSDNRVAILTLETNLAAFNVTLLKLDGKLDALEAHTDAHGQQIASLEISDQGRTKAIERLDNGFKHSEDALEQLRETLSQLEAVLPFQENKQADSPFSVDHSPRLVRTSTSGSNPKKGQLDSPPSEIRSRGPRIVRKSRSNPTKEQLDSPPSDVYSREPVLNDSMQSIPDRDLAASVDGPQRSMHNVDTESNEETDQSDPSLSFNYPRKGKLNDSTEPDPEDDRSLSIVNSRTSKHNHGTKSSPKKFQPPSVDDRIAETTVIQKTETSPERSQSKNRSPIRHDEHSQTTGDAVDLTWLKSFAALQQDHNRLAKDHTDTQHTVQNHGESLQNLADRCNQLDGRLALVEAKQKTPENTFDGQDRALFEDDAELKDPNQRIDSPSIPSAEDTPLLNRNRSPVTNSPSLPATRSDDQSELTKLSPTESKATMTDLPPSNPRQPDEPKSQLNEKDQSNDRKNLAPLERPEGQPQSSLNDNKALQDRLNKLEERVQQMEEKHERDINELRREFDEKLKERMKDLQQKLNELLSPMNGFKPSQSPTPISPSVPQLQAKGKIPFIEFGPPIDLFTNEDTFGL